MQRIILNKQSKAGLTLVELLIYVGLLSGILIVSMSVVTQMSAVNTKNSSYISVTNNLRWPLTRIAQEIRNAKSILSLTANTITLESFDPTRNPTVISWDGSQILMGIGGSGPCNTSSPCAITDNQTTITSWQVTDRSVGANRSLKVEIVANNNQLKNSFKRSEAFVVSATLRSK